MVLKNKTSDLLPLNPKKAPEKPRVLAQPWFRRRLQWFMLCRVVVASFFLGTVAIVQVQAQDSLLRPELVWLYALTVCVYMLSLLYVLLLPALKDLKPFVCIQIALDLLCIAVLLLATGGIAAIVPGAIVAAEKDQRIIAEPVLFDGVKQSARLLIHVFECVIINGPIGCAILRRYIKRRMRDRV